jgi:hypothetical protein
VWFSDCDDVRVTSTLAWLSDNCRDNHILAQVYQLISRLCAVYNLNLPSDLARLSIPMQVCSVLLVLLYTRAPFAEGRRAHVRSGK